MKDIFWIKGTQMIPKGDGRTVLLQRAVQVSDAEGKSKRMCFVFIVAEKMNEILCHKTRLKPKEISCFNASLVNQG